MTRRLEDAAAGAAATPPEAAASAIPEGWRVLPLGGLWSALGPLLARRAEDGEGWLYALQTDDRHGNPLGLVHGGALCALLDQAAALLAFDAAGRIPAVTVQQDARFLAAARVGAFLTVRARLRHAAGGLTFLDSTVREGERPVAEATAILKVAQHRKPGGKDGGSP